MNKKMKVINKLLTKKVLIMLFFLIAFFTFHTKGNAAYFNYSEFDFDKFAKENRSYWTSHCTKETTEDGEEKCVETVLQRQKNYYTTLYTLLAKYQKKGLLIDDNIIIMTSFFELDPDLFSDSGSYYKSLMGSDYTAYNANNDLTDYDINADDDVDELEAETDTLKLLTKAMIGYSYTCNGSYGPPTAKKLEDETTVYVCDNSNANIVGNECIVTATKGHMGFWEYVISKSGVASFFGLKSDAQKECDELASSYPGGTTFVPGSGAEVSEDNYWDFLVNGNYFDRKSHLSYRFKGILKSMGKTSVAELNDEELEEYNNKLVQVRQNIVNDIKAILENYGSQNMLSLYTNAASDAYWWPVGGSEVTTDGTGKEYAIGEPVSTSITSLFGPRIHPLTGEDSFHYGVDLVGPDNAAGVYNIIAAKSGIVTNVIDGCVSYGETSCGGGYGNYVILSHADGNYSLYAHLHENSISVANGDSVNQGQIIGKMGSSGSSTGTHLHFEVRSGDSTDTAVDPLGFISATDPRKASSMNSDLEAMLVCMEGKGPDDGGDNYTVYDDKCPRSCSTCGGTLTVGAGVTLKWQADKFSAHGVNVNDYYYPCAKIPKTIVDSIKSQIISNDYDNVNSTLTSNGISLLSYQIDALVSRKYNTGNITNFPSNYNLYGNTQKLYDNYMSMPTTSGGEFMPGLVNRRNYEWNLFHNGVYHTC